MKCLCGYVEPEDWEEDVEILYQSGPRKGEVKEVKHVYHEVPDEELFIKIEIERGFKFTKTVHELYGRDEVDIKLYACPKCHTIKLVN